MGHVPAGPDIAFDDFYRSEYRNARKLAWLLTHSTQECEEIVQEAFLSLFRSFDTVRDPGAYLHKAITNSCRSFYRRKRTAHQRLRVGLVADTPDSVQPDFRDILSGLPYRQRVVIVGRYWGGWSEAELADTLGCRPGTVKSLASRALARIQKQIGDDDDFR